MARLRAIQYGRRFIASCRRAGVKPGSREATALVATLHRLAITAELPAPEDVKTRIPPVWSGYARRVRAFNLWVYYEADDTKLLAVVVTRNPPVPDVDLS